jgi:hypothetical protein
MKNNTATEEVKPDAVSHPSHYCRGGLECIDAIKACVIGLDGFEGMCTGNTIKYMWRWKYKNGKQDLLKAKEYIDMLIAKLDADDKRR